MDINELLDTQIIKTIDEHKKQMQALGIDEKLADLAKYQIDFYKSFGDLENYYIKNATQYMKYIENTGIKRYLSEIELNQEKYSHLFDINTQLINDSKSQIDFIKSTFDEEKVAQLISEAHKQFEYLETLGIDKQILRASEIYRDIFNNVDMAEIFNVFKEYGDTITTEIKSLENISVQDNGTIIINEDEISPQEINNTLDSFFKDIEQPAFWINIQINLQEVKEPIRIFLFWFINNIVLPLIIGCGLGFYFLNQSLTKQEVVISSLTRLMNYLHVVILLDALEQKMTSEMCLE